MKIIKRNGQEAQFDKTKISSAISKANEEVSGSDKLNKDSIDTIASSIEKYATSCGRSLNVEEIQDMVEDHIMDLGKHNLARRYITYRYRRSIARKANTTDDQILSLIDCNNEEIKQENSNKNPTVASVQRDYMAGEVSKDISRRILLPEDVVHAHDEGIIHFHDMDYYSQHMHNCFHEKTKFYTSEGVRSFRDFSEGDSVRVIDKDGQFRDATVHSYGNQLMQKVVFKSCRRRKEVICTRDHRWILHDGTVTTSLQVGDRLACLKDTAADCHPDTIRECKMFALGFLIGDGCDSYNSHDTSCGYSEITLCNNKIQYYDILRKAGYNSGYTTKAGYVVVSNRGAMKQSFLNSFGWRYLSEEDKKWIFLGLFAADGSYNISYDIDSSDERICQMIREISYFAGYYISSEHTRVESTNYKKDAKSTRFTLVTHQTSNHCWKVESISKTGRYKSWCIVEPVTHSFMLEGGMITGNCDLINLEDMLQNGTVISGTMIEKPHSFSTACNVATQIIAQVASCQYGGQSITLSHLAPFVDVSRNKIRSEVESEILPLKDELADRFSEVVSNITEKRVREEIKRGVQTIQYQVVTLMTTNGQAPFITVFMYIDEVPEGRTREDLCLIIEEVLRQRIQGVKNEKGVWITPAFPKLIYCLDEDNVYPDSKYYYLTELAAKCTAKRMVPDYISAKKMKELKGDVYPAMGALAAKEHLYVRIDDNEPIDLSIKELFDYCYQHIDIVGRPAQLHFPKDRLNPDLNSLNDCISADCEPNSGVYRITYVPEDVSYIGSTDNMRRRWTEHRWAIRNTGGIDGGMCFADNNLDNYLFEVIAYCDNYRQLETEYIMSEPNCNIRGTRNKLYKVSNRNLEPQYSRPNFTFKTRIPQCLIDISSLNIKVYDRGNKWTRIRNIFKNDKSNTPLMMEIRYIENGKKFSLSCTEDHPVWTGTGFTRADNLKVGEFLYRADGVKLPIVDIEWYSHPVDSYDISTETGTFIGSDIQMHNCRSFLTPDRFTDNGVGNIADAKNYIPGKHKYYGRFNQGVVTINLVDAGLTAVNNLKSKGRMNSEESQYKNEILDEFWNVLDERLELCHKALRCRHERLKGTLSDTCPILWQYGALSRLNKGEKIDKLLYNGYSTISLGYAGLWECVYALIGKKLTESEGKELGLEIMRKLNEYTAKWKKAENIDYSLYGTPIESTTYRFAKCLQRRFGRVKGVTDKNYITNSYHVHVTEPIDAFSKLKLESEFQELSPGGAISYVEVPNMQNNIPAVLTVMTFIYDNIIYAELNTKSDYCQVCGYNGEIQIVESDGKLVWECPNCGNHDQTKMNVARRTCGYIGTQFWNQGRTQEIKERVLHL